MEGTTTELLAERFGSLKFSLDNESLPDVELVLRAEITKEIPTIATCTRTEC